MTIGTGGYSLEATSRELEDLIGRSPDPVGDRRALRVLCDADNVALCRLVEHLHTREDWRQIPLRELFPGLDLVKCPEFSDRLSIRAVNRVVGVGSAGPKVVADATPESLGAIEGVGPRTVEEILAAVASAWASEYLDPVPNPPEIKARPVGTTAPLNLALAFEELEARRNFDVFARHQLSEGSKPTVRALGVERGVSGGRIQEMVSVIGRLLSKSMNDREWPIRIAVDGLQDHLGSVARPKELPAAFAAVDPSGRGLPETMPHRRILLLQLSDYKVSGEWVLGPNIENITTVVLEAVVRDGAADLDTVSSHLSRFGIREELQLPWILSRHGFRIIDSEVVPLM